MSRMKAAYGNEQAREIMIDGTPHVMIFPNLFIAEIQLFVIQPLAADDSVQHVTALQFKGAPDMNRRLRQQTMGSVGPAGFLLADNSEMYERMPSRRAGPQSRMDLPRPRRTPRTARRGRFQGRPRHRRSAVARHLAALSQPDGGAGDAVARKQRHAAERRVGFPLYGGALCQDEHQYEAWEALWTDDGVYWVPANGADIDPEQEMSIIYDNRSRIRLGSSNC